MAWSDLRGQSMNTLTDLLGMRNQRRMQRTQNITDFGSQLSRQAFESGEAEKQREFSGDQAELQRDFTTGEREAGEEFTAGQAAEARSWESEQARLDRAHEIARDTMNNDAAYNRLEAQIQAEKDAMQRAWEDPARRYGETQSFYSPRTEKTYSWRTQQEHQMAMAELEGDLLADRIQLQASLGAGEDAQDWVEMYTGIRNDVMSDYGNLWNGEMWLGVPDEQLRTRIISEFNSAIDGLVQAGQRSPQWAEWAKDRFENYVSNATAADAGEAPQEPVGRGGIPLTTPIARDFAEDRTGLLGQAATPLVELFGRVFPEDAARLLGDRGEVPRGVRMNNFQNESQIWSELTSLVESGDLNPNELQTAEQYIKELANEGYAGRDVINNIRSFIDRALAGGRNAPASPGGGL